MSLTHEDFYDELVSRNTGLIAPSTQRRIRSCRILIAGCGSTGGATAEPLTRLGVESFVLAEPDMFELSNLNRQNAGVADIGKNKAEVASQRIRNINPHAECAVIREGLTDQNTADLVRSADVIMDGVDVTTAVGWSAKMALHRHAASLRVPVLSGYDLGSTQYTQFYDYAARAMLPFDDRIDVAQVFSGPFAMLAKVIPPSFVPRVLIDVVRRAPGTEFSVPQLADTAAAFGLIAVRTIIRYLQGEPVAAEIALDLDRLVSTTATAELPDPTVSAWFSAAIR